MSASWEGRPEPALSLSKRTPVAALVRRGEETKQHRHHEYEGEYQWLAADPLAPAGEQFAAYLRACGSSEPKLTPLSRSRDD
jgi:hypothetical protein